MCLLGKGSCYIFGVCPFFRRILRDLFQIGFLYVWSGFERLIFLWRLFLEDVEKILSMLWFSWSRAMFFDRYVLRVSCTLDAIESWTCLSRWFFWLINTLFCLIKRHQQQVQSKRVFDCRSVISGTGMESFFRQSISCCKGLLSRSIFFLDITIILVWSSSTVFKPSVHDRGCGQKLYLSRSVPV